MKAVSILLLVALPLVVGAATSSDQYTFDFRDEKNPVVIFPTEDDIIFGADASSLSATRQLLQPIDPNVDPCYYSGAKLVCEYRYYTDGFVEDENGEQIEGRTWISFRAVCAADSRYKFDFRKANGCSCQAKVEHPKHPVKMCYCTVCAEGFGKNPINVDCTEPLNNNQQQPTVDTTTTEEQTKEDGSTEVTDSVTISDSVALPADDIDPADGSVTIEISDSVTVKSGEKEPEHIPYIVNTCTSIDCTNSCNGTCDMSCQNSDESCLYCANNPLNQPTASPTGGGDGVICNFGEDCTAKSAAAATPLVVLKATLTAVAMLIFMV